MTKHESDAQNSRIVVTGGSGFIGTAAVDYALKRGYSVANLDIKPPHKEEHEKYWQAIDIRNRDDLSQALIAFHPTHILHLAAKTGMDLKDLNELSANTNGVQYLIDIARGLPDLKKIIFTSSLLVCRNGYIPNNETDYCPPNLYGESKVMGEWAVRQARDLPYSWTIVRPTSVWGSWFEHSYKTFFKMIDKGLYFHPGGQDIVKPIIYVGNAVYMMFNMLLDESGETNGATYYLADYPVYTVREWADTIQRELGKAKIKTVPLPILMVVALLGDCLKSVGLADPPLTSFRLSNMLTGGLYPTEKTQAFVGELPYSLEDGVRQTVHWMRSQGEIG
jgi:nucleoside-diphosphate-sugar epimerase